MVETTQSEIVEGNVMPAGAQSLLVQQRVESSVELTADVIYAAALKQSALLTLGPVFAQSKFTQSVRESICNGIPLSAGAVSILIDIAARYLAGGAKRHSRAFTRSLSDAQAAVDEVVIFQKQVEMCMRAVGGVDK